MKASALQRGSARKGWPSFFFAQDSNDYRPGSRTLRARTGLAFTPPIVHRSGLCYGAGGTPRRLYAARSGPLDACLTHTARAGRTAQPWPKIRPSAPARFLSATHTIATGGRLKCYTPLTPLFYAPGPAPAPQRGHSAALHPASSLWAGHRPRRAAHTFCLWVCPALPPGSAYRLAQGGRAIAHRRTPRQGQSKCPAFYTWGRAALTRPRRRARCPRRQNESGRTPAPV